MKRLLGYEIKKILMKKSTIVTFVILFGIQMFLAIAGSLGSTYVEDAFVETHMERNRIDRENGIALSGRVLDDELLAEITEAYGKIEWNDRTYLLSEGYQSEVRKYSDLISRLKAWGFGSALSAGGLTEEVFYDMREVRREELWDSQELTEKERAYWLEKEAALEYPFTYEYTTAYEYLLTMHGGYMCCMLLTFFIAVSMVGVFAEEHSRKTDQLVLCTKHGRYQLYFAKILAGSIVVFGTNLLFILVALAGNFFSYGAEGFQASIQVATAFWYSYELSAGEAVLIIMGLLLLSSVMVAAFAMVLAEILRSAIGAMAIIVGGLFVARLVVIPASWGLMSQLWNYIPINLLKVDQGFTDLRLVSVFGLQLTSWQFAPIMYVLITVAVIVIGNKVYRSYQVSGR